MDRSALLSVITPVSRPHLLPVIAGTVPVGAEWVLVTDGPLDIPAGLRPHLLVEGPATGRWGDVQRQVGLEAATRPFVTFLDDDNVMLPILGDLVIPALETSGLAGAVFGLLLLNPGGFYIWPPPVRIERSQVDTAMFLGRTEIARQVGWPDLAGGAWPGLEAQRCGDFVFLRAFDEQAGLLRLPMIAGFHDGVGVIRHHAPDLFAALSGGEPVGDRLLAMLHRYMGQADAPPWWKGRSALTQESSPPRSVVPDVVENADPGTSSATAPWLFVQRLVRRLAGDRPGQPVLVLEIGFGVGRGTSAVLGSTRQAHVVSFDLGVDPGVLPGVAQLRTLYPDRLQVVIGDSRQTLPMFAGETGGRFDLIVVNRGDEEDTCRHDVLDARAAAAPGARVIVTDLLPRKDNGSAAARAFTTLLAESVLAEPEMWVAGLGARTPELDTGQPLEGCAWRWGQARYSAGP